MANKPISTPKGVTFGTLPPRDPSDSGPTENTGSEAARSRPITFGEPHPPTAPKTEKPADPFAFRQFNPKPEISREERIAAGIETPPKPHPKPQSFQQPERKPDTPLAGPPLTRAELVGDVETPVDIRTVQQAEAEEERLAKQQRLTDEIDIEVAHRREAKRKQAEADKAKAEADAKARTNQLLHKK